MKKKLMVFLFLCFGVQLIPGDYLHAVIPPDDGGGIVILPGKLKNVSGLPACDCSSAPITATCACAFPIP